MDQTDTPNSTVPAFSYQLLRDVLIPEILGKDHEMIQYWAGKSLARKYPLETIEKVIDFFRQAGWGSLLVETEGKTSIVFSLTSEMISERMNHDKNISFSLESGFLAQQIQLMRNRYSDAQSSIKRGRKVSITVHWDPKDVVQEINGRRSRK